MNQSDFTSASQQVVDGPQAWLTLALSILVSSIGTVGIWAVVVVLPSVQAEFGVDRALASLPYTATMTGFAIGNVVVGRFLDRVGVRLPLLLSSVLLFCGFVLSALTTSIWQFALLHGLVIGVGSSTCFGPLMANISHWFKRRRGIAVAATACGTYIAGAVWPLVMKGFIEQAGWRMTYAGIGIFCLVTIVPLALLLRNRPPAHPPEQTSESLISDGLFNARSLQVSLMLAGVACCVAMSMPQVHIIPYSMDLGFKAARGAEMLSVMLAGGVISRIAFGFIADRFGGLRTCLLAASLQCVALVLFLPVSGMAALYVVSLLFGLSQGGIVPSYAIIVREYLPAKEAGERVGLVIMSTIFGMALGGFMSGWIYDQSGSYELAFINGIVWNLMNLVVLGALTYMAFRRPRTTGPSY